VPTGTRIKHCGITSYEDATLAVEAGAWALGMIFWPGSPRACDPAVAARIAHTYRRAVQLVGVFVDQPLDQIATYAEEIPLGLVQLHGDEGTAFCAEVARRTGAKVVKAARIGSRADLQALQAFRNVDYHLVDARVEGMHGGTGQVVDWELVATRQSEVPLVLSGGLTAENVGEAVARVAPFAVDVASGTEASPGVKDPAKLLAFAEAVRAADPQPEPEPEPEPEAGAPEAAAPAATESETVEAS
jgi:phosphoribosylanthranilate isomerase